ncbi:Calcium uniporter protein 2- mitochondrial [Striga hermonthica]|uniref:Calcium uniporter protein 2- mitochondrial n=1 Tax=Striga hermonthica TaxID=68872 RepID=A0A9N7NMM8_STRHE|nr:Calcium uniporter protein 2- mitochondrial [Striga hermonthica]
MAFTRMLAPRLLRTFRSASASTTNCRVSSPCAAAQSVVLNRPTAPSNLSPDPGDDGVFRRYIHNQSAAAGAASADPRFLPTGEKLLEKLRGMGIARQRIRIDSLMPPPAAEVEEVEKEPPLPEGTITVKDAVKILRVSQLEAVRSRLRRIERDCIPYSEFVEICAVDCSSVEQGIEFAKMLDQSGSVIVLGKIVFLRPEQVVKAIQGLIPVPTPSRTLDDPSMQELCELEKRKSQIDIKAKLLVQRELWCGLGYLIVQTAALMRLTFWELSWDVMEPICFSLTSFYFMGGYAFFLRTSKEPTFEGFFQSRFGSKQKKLMKAEKFDVERYNELKKAYASAKGTDNVVFTSYSSSPVA